MLGDRGRRPDLDRRHPTPVWQRETEQPFAPPVCFDLIEQVREFIDDEGDEPTAASRRPITRARCSHTVMPS